MGNTTSQKSNYEAYNNKISKVDMIKKFENIIFNSKKDQNDDTDLETLNWSAAEGNVSKPILERNIGQNGGIFTSNNDTAFSALTDNNNFSEYSELEQLQQYLNNMTGGGCGCDDSRNTISSATSSLQSSFQQDGGARKTKAKKAKKTKKSGKKNKLSREVTTDSETEELTMSSSSDDSSSDNSSSSSSDGDVLSEGNNFKTNKNPKINVVPFYSTESTSENYNHLQTKNKFL